MNSNTKPKQKPLYQNPLETVKTASDRALSQEQIEMIMAQRSMLEQREKAPMQPRRSEFTVFSRSEHYETKVRPQEIDQLVSEVRREVADIKRVNNTVLSEVEDIEKNTLQSIPEKPGIYHVRFLEMILLFLRGLKKKVGEASTWLEAMQSKRAKRGSAFSIRAKKKGTQYSMSQELQTARNVM